MSVKILDGKMLVKKINGLNVSHAAFFCFLTSSLENKRLKGLEMKYWDIGEQIRQKKKKRTPKKQKTQLMDTDNSMGITRGKGGGR